MRISDWSSDVCSSDLPDFDAAVTERSMDPARPVQARFQTDRTQSGRRIFFGDRCRRPRCRIHLRAAESAVSAELQRLQSAVERSEEHTSELQSLMRISYAVFCLKKKKKQKTKQNSASAKHVTCTQTKRSRQLAH